MTAPAGPPSVVPIGRERDVEAVTALLAEGRRLVTITGSGGVGKTVVAAEVARITTESGRATVVFAPMADVEPGTAATSLARILAGPRPSSDDDDAVLHTVLHDGAVLLVLDTFERLRDEVAVVTSLLDRFPDLQVLVTSRVRLRLRAEAVVVLGPLDPQAAATMFVQRAEAATGTALDPDEPLVGEVCDALGCHPLAIELAAARVGVLPPEALLRALRASGSSAVAALTRGPVDGHVRHRDLAGTLDWTYELLSPAAQEAFLALGVASGPLDLAAVTALCPPAVAHPLDALAELVDVHLVTPIDADTATGPETRYGMLPTIAAYAGARLERHGDLDAARRRWADHVQAWLAEAGVGLRTAHALTWQHRIARDLGEVEALLSYRHESGHQDLGLQAAVAVAPYWLEVGPRQAGHRWLVRLLRMGHDAPEADLVRLQAEAWEAHFAADGGDRRGLDRLAAATDDLRAAGAPAAVLVPITELLVRSHTSFGQLDEAEERARWCEAACHDHHLAESLPSVLFRLAFIARQRGRRRAALELIRAGRDAAAAVGDAGFLARSEAFLRNEIAVELGADAVGAIEEAVERSVGARQRTAAVWAMVTAAAAAATAGDTPAALSWARAALDAAAEIDQRQAEWCSTAVIASLALDRSMYESGLGLHGGLAPHLDELAAGLVPPEHLEAYHRTVAHAVAAVGANRAAALMAGGPTDWPGLLDAARRVADKLDGALRGGGAPPPGLFAPGQVEPLTDRELEVLAALARGGTNRQVAAQLHISPKTVMHHAANIYRKLAVRNRAEAVALALRSGALS